MLCIQEFIESSTRYNIQQQLYSLQYRREVSLSYEKYLNNIWIGFVILLFKTNLLPFNVFCLHKRNFLQYVKAMSRNILKVQYVVGLEPVTTKKR